MKFKHWNKGTTHRWYAHADTLKGKAWLSINRAGKLYLNADDPEEEIQMERCLLGAGMALRGEYTAEGVTETLLTLDLLATSKKPGKAKPFVAGNKPAPAPAAYVDTRAPEELFAEALALDVASAPFRKGTLGKAHIIVDSREPASIAETFKTSKLGASVSVNALPIGDIQVGSTLNDDVLLVERKTVTDFYNSIISTHAHHQAERLFEFQRASAAQGIAVRVVWIIEAEQDGARGLYNTLPQVKQIDGMIAYLTGILGQHVLSAYNANHLCYLTLKLAQAYIEKELIYPVKSSNGLRVDTKAKDRTFVELAPAEDAAHHGVRLNNRGLAEQLQFLEHISIRVARSMAASGKSLRELVQMSPDELMVFDGVGHTMAQRIYETFNKVG